MHLCGGVPVSNYLVMPVCVCVCVCGVCVCVLTGGWIQKEACQATHCKCGGERAEPSREATEDEEEEEITDFLQRRWTGLYLAYCISDHHSATAVDTLISPASVLIGEVYSFPQGVAIYQFHTQHWIQH